jgi:CRP-like cAMP-binding protein
VQTDTSTPTNGRRQPNIITAIRDAKGAVRRRVARKQFLFELDQIPTGVCLIESGIAAQAIDDGSKRQIMGFFGRGDLLFAGRLLAEIPGDPSVFLGNSTLALTAVEVIEVPWGIARHIPHLVSTAGALVEKQRVALERRLLAVSYHLVQERLAALIVELAEKFGVKQQGGGTLIAAPVTHQDMADAIGSTRETVSLTLRQFTTSGRISFDKRRIVVWNFPELRVLAAS